MNRRTIEYVRIRAGYSCEYCGTDEEGAGGELTVDHFHPQSRGGAEDPANLVYACIRCNDYKADYWPTPEIAPYGTLGTATMRCTSVLSLMVRFTGLLRRALGPFCVCG